MAQKLSEPKASTTPPGATPEETKRLADAARRQLVGHSLFNVSHETVEQICSTDQGAICLLEVTKKIPAELELTASILSSMVAKVSRLQHSSLKEVGATSVQIALLVSKTNERPIVALGNPTESLANDAISTIVSGAIALGLSLQTVPGSFHEYSTDSSVVDFLSGFMTELMSVTSSSVSHIKYTERSSHSNGRSCARLEQLKILAGPSRQAYLRNISDEIIGSSAKKQPFLIRKIASSFHKDDKDMILEALLRLVKWSVTGRETEVRKKFSSIFFPTFGDLHHTVKRKKETQSKKGKKLSTATITLEPCKPSQLSTVTPYERPLIRALYEGPWKACHELETLYNEQDPFERDYPSLLTEVRRIDEAMWRNKSLVLRLTKGREVRPKGGDTSLTGRIRATSEEYSKCTDQLAMRGLWTTELDIPWLHDVKPGYLKYTSEAMNLREFINSSENMLAVREYIQRFNEFYKTVRPAEPVQTKDSIISENRFAVLDTSSSEEPKAQTK